MTIANLTRTIGVEIETIVPSPLRRAPHGPTVIARAITQAFEDAGISQSCYWEGYSHTTQSHWKVVSDGSLDGRGYEVVSPPLNAPAMKAQLIVVCAALQSLGCTIERSTGLHVHHDAADLTAQQIGRAFATYATFQTLFSMMVAPSRRISQWSAPLSWERITNNGTDKFDNDNRGRRAGDSIEAKIHARVNRTRYAAMNIEAIFVHGTIEFRQHQGTLNAEKIMNWILITQSIIESAVQGTGRSLKPTTVIRAEGKPDAFRKRGEFARFRDTIAVSPSANKVPLSQADAATWTQDWQDVEDNCNAYYEPAFRYFAKVVKKFAAAS